MTYKLYYFNGRGRAELSRLVFAEAKVDYEDVRLEGAQWGEMKAAGKTPFGQLPALEVDGQVFAQSMAMARFLARKFSLMGNNELEGLRVDMICEAGVDVANKLAQLFWGTPEDQKAAFSEKLAKEILPAQLAGLHKALGNGPFFLGETFSLADLAIFNVLESVKGAFPQNFESSGLKEFFERVAARPNVAAWLAKRPATQW
jgi:glutathione S-transferase